MIKFICEGCKLSESSKVNTVPISKLKYFLEILNDFVEDAEEYGMEVLNLSSSPKGMRYYLGLKDGFLNLNSLEDYIEYYEEER